MPDPGARFTDEQIAELEARLTAMYEQAYTDVREKYTAFVKKFLREDKIYRQKLKDGEIDKDVYDAWLRGQVFQKTRWEAQLDDLAQTLTHTTQTAMDIINEAAPGVFAMNANYAEYEIEKAGSIDMGFGLYDEDTVRRLVRDDPDLLPPSKVNTPLEQQWNKTLINRQIGVGIIAGEGIMAIADRLQRAATMSRNQALTHARTAMTGAQNAGRIEGYHRAEQMGIKLEKEWLATQDGHTRRAHAALDGQHVPVDKPFKSLLGNIMYPGDPSAHPANVFNCRCTLISHLLEYPSENARRRPNLQQLGDEEVQKPIKDMTYQEWAKLKSVAKTLNNTQENGIIDIVREAIGVKKGASLNIKKAAEGANPNYSSGREYQLNCQRCVFAYELRRRGYNVIAKAKPLKNGRFDPNDKIVYGSETYTDQNGNAVRFAFGKTEQQIKETIENSPVGSRFAIYVAWKNARSAHVFSAERAKNGVRYVDPQNGALDASSYFARGRTSSFGILRVDDKAVNEDKAILASAVERKRK